MWFCQKKRSFSASRTPSSGSTLFIDAPSPISVEQLKELSCKVILPEKAQFSASRTPSSGSTFFIDAPSPISEEQLEELSIDVVLSEKA